jgi:putative flippase GtrA
MITFLKAQASSLIATLVDFLVTILFVEMFGMWDVSASAVGNVCGGVANFLVNRIWVFEATNKKSTPQAVRYFVVWVGNIALNSAGLYLLRHFTGLNYVTSKVLVATVVGFSYNYVLQKKFVFR